MNNIEKKHPTEAQRRLLRRLSGELEGGARYAFQEFLKQLEGKLAAQRLEQSCETTESVTQLVNYTRLFDGCDGELKLTYHNPAVTDANFKTADVLKWFEHGTAMHEFRVYRPKRRISSVKVIALMKKDGYRPATALELLEYYVSQLLQGVIVRWFVLVSLGTVVQGDVVYLSLDPTFRYLNLGTFGSGWNEAFEFLAVRETEQA